MSIWYPRSGMTYEQYLQKDSFVRDVTGQIKKSSKGIEARVTEQTKSIVAGQEHLARTFGEGFDRVNGTLEWGFNRIGSSLDSIEGSLDNIDSSIQSLHSDFNYNMSLLLAQMQAQTGLLSTLVGKLDVINRTLESPTLTQAREYYKIGLDRRAKGLLDKALEAFQEAEKKNDTDFFTQFEIGKLYLDGIDEDDNVQDLDKAKHHLLLAARYAKAEISRDSSFAQLAAEALLRASISLYAKLGNPEYRDNEKLSDPLLEEARRLAMDAVSICPRLSEASYHIAKYSSLLNDQNSTISYLEKSISSDRNYAVKVDIDHAFEPMRPLVIKLLEQMRESKRIEALNLIDQSLNEFQALKKWYPADGDPESKYLPECQGFMNGAQSSFELGTYFGYLDAIHFAKRVMALAPDYAKEKNQNLRDELKTHIASVKVPYATGSEQAKSFINIANDFLTKASESEWGASNFKDIQEGISFVNSAKEAAQKAWEETSIDNSAKAKLAKDEADREALMRRRSEASSKNASAGARIGAILGFVIGCVGCLGGAVTNSSMAVCGFPFFGAIIGIILGSILGYLSGQAVS